MDTFKNGPHIPKRTSLLLEQALEQMIHFLWTLGTWNREERTK